MRELQDRGKNSLLTSRLFALILIASASLYVLVMICQAVKSQQGKLVSTEYESEYQYQTESYDFRPYQSLDTDNGRSEARGFKYNQSIHDHSSHRDDDNYMNFNSGSGFMEPHQAHKMTE